MHGTKMATNNGNKDHYRTWQNRKAEAEDQFWWTRRVELIWVSN